MAGKRAQTKANLEMVKYAGGGGVKWTLYIGHAFSPAISIRFYFFAVSAQTRANNFWREKWYFKGKTMDMALGTHKRPPLVANGCGHVIGACRCARAGQVCMPPGLRSGRGLGKVRQQGVGLGLRLEDTPDMKSQRGAAMRKLTSARIMYYLRSLFRPTRWVGLRVYRPCILRRLTFTSTRASLIDHLRTPTVPRVHGRTFMLLFWPMIPPCTRWLSGLPLWCFLSLICLQLLLPTVPRLQHLLSRPTRW